MRVSNCNGVSMDPSTADLAKAESSGRHKVDLSHVFFDNLDTRDTPDRRINSYLSHFAPAVGIRVLAFEMQVLARAPKCR